MAKRSFSAEEFAQHVQDRLERLEGRTRGLHFVLNAMANELRNADLDLALRISEAIEDQARRERISPHVQEVVEIYVGVLTHGALPPVEEQQ